MKLCYVICLSALYICAIWTHEILKKTRFTMKRNMRYRTNVTILNELAGRNTDCVRACVNTPGCISANLHGGNAFERKECQLIGSYDVNDLEVDQQSDFIYLGPEYPSPTYYIGSTWGSWYEGHAECAEHGGHMAIIRDIDEFERAYDVIGGTHFRFWIDGTDLSYGTWIWSTTNETLSVEHPGWLPSEPNGLPGEHCLCWYEWERGWHDCSCNTAYSMPLCQRP